MPKGEWQRDVVSGRFTRPDSDKCRRGHEGSRLKDGRCSLCVRENNRKWQAKNLESRRAYGREYMRTVGRWKKFGLSRSQYLALAAEHGGMCAICQEEPDELCIDHNHTTGKVRGLLCSKCNSAIGLLRDCPELAHRAALYLDLYG